MAHVIDPVPLASRRTYEVRQGDTIEKITAQFVRQDRWPELVAVNQMHKGLVDGPPESDHKVFTALEVGEHLLLPASWIAGGHGALGLPYSMVNQGSGAQQSGGINPNAGIWGSITFDPTASFIYNLIASWPVIEQMVKQPYPQFQIPAGYTSADIGNVLSGWLPYLTANYDVTKAPTTWGPEGMDALAKAINNAAVLLGAAKVQSDIFRSLPWQRVGTAWTTFPWQATVVAGNPAATQAIWALIVAASQPPIQVDSATPRRKAVASGAVPFDPTIQNIGPEVWPPVPFGNIPWADLDPSILANVEVQRCLKDPGATARLQDMATHKDCFLGAGVEKFKKYLCPKGDGSGTYEDLSKCGEPTTPGLPPAASCPAETTPTQTQVGPVCLPSGLPLPAGFNWNCAPYPQCIYDQIAALVPAGQTPLCPPPGTAWPACIPDLVKQYGVNLPAGPAPAAEPAKDNTGLYVALGLGGAVLLGGVLYAMTRTPSGATNSEQPAPNPAPHWGSRPSKMSAKRRKSR